MVCTSDFRGSFYVSDSSWPWPSQAGPAVCAQAGWLQVKSCPSPHEYYSCELRGEVQSFGMAHLSGLSKQCHKCDSGSWLLVQLKKEIRVFELVYMFIVLCHERFFSFFVEFFFFLLFFNIFFRNGRSWANQFPNTHSFVSPRVSYNCSSHQDQANGEGWCWPLSGLLEKGKSRAGWAMQVRLVS